MVSRENGSLIMDVGFCYPKWLDELSENELSNVLKSAEDKAVMAFAGEIYKAEQRWCDRKSADMLGQMDIYDYV